MENLEKKFNQLKKKWEEETINLSSAQEIINNKNYQEIIKIGKPVIPFLLRDLKIEPNFWFTALREITGKNPVTSDMAGRIDEMSKAWIKWGEKNGYC